MESTTFLAQLWGPVTLAIGIGIFVSRSYYIKIYRDLEKDALAGLLFGMVSMVAGVAHVLAHNAWGSFTEGLISFLGWVLFIKGALFVIAPKHVDRAGNYWANNKFRVLSRRFHLVKQFYA